MSQILGGVVGGFLWGGRGDFNDVKTEFGKALT